MQRVVIIVPIYKTELDVFELTAMKQLFKVLSQHPIVFVMPEGLRADIEDLCEVDIKYQREFFSQDYFKSTKTYSRLCLNEEFYRRFLDYEYMLIYQMDAFVFSDRLDEFIDYGYDYIGAPQANAGFKDFHVGNGGFSLRKISKSIDALAKKKEILSQLPRNLQELYMDYEDNFWGYCGFNSNIDFNVPRIELAAEFALMGNRLDLYQNMIEKGLPFGLHAWSYCDYRFWKPIIEGYGYNLPDEKTVKFRDEYPSSFINRMKSWWDKLDEEGIEDVLKATQLKRNLRYTVWGNGKYGKKVQEVFSKLGLEVVKIMDTNNYDGITNDKGVRLAYPSKEEIMGSDIIVIAIKGMYEELSNEIHEIDRRIKVVRVEEIIRQMNCLYEDKFERENVKKIQEKLKRI